MNLADNGQPYRRMQTVPWFAVVRAEIGEWFFATCGRAEQADVKYQRYSVRCPTALLLASLLPLLLPQFLH